ncbi:MAG: RluA family pseudouridine synthase [Acidobacteria bacterium]|nr:RluA family pseudouridine synthase [Acidobacteriota bacterium]
MNQGYEYRERIIPEGVGRSVASYLAWRYPHTSLEAWEERILQGRVLLDGWPAEPRRAVQPGQILVWVRPPWEEPNAPLSFAVLFRDDHLLAVLKPAGLPTLPGGGYLEHTLLAILRRSYPEASPVHRIGRGTTGLVLCARSDEAARSLTSAWRRQRVRKIYRALVSGRPVRDRYSVDAPIGRVPHRRALFKAHAAVSDGKRALSHVQVLERLVDASLVEVEIVTGRPHQVRIHLAACGHPLVGDRFYGPGGVPRAETEVGPGEGGFLLHSHRLLLRHPVSGQALELEAPLPPGLLTSAEQ